jgi:hypothetical protein
VLTGCDILWNIFGPPKDDQFIVKRVYPHAIENTAVQGLNIAFQVVCVVGDPCWFPSHNEFATKNNGQDIYVSVYAKRDKKAVCPQVISIIKPIVKYSVKTVGEYRFHFWKSDTTTMDTTIVVR